MLIKLLTIYDTQVAALNPAHFHSICLKTFPLPRQLNVSDRSGFQVLSINMFFFFNVNAEVDYGTINKCGIYEGVQHAH